MFRANGFLVLFFVLLSSINLTEAQDHDNSLQFGDSILELSAAERNYDIRYPTLSADGYYVFANLNHRPDPNMTMVDNIQQAIWTVDWRNQATEIQIYQDIEDNKVAALFLNDYIALRTSTEVQLRAIEDFSIIGSVEILAPFMPEILPVSSPYYSYLVKSPSGVDLATFGDESFWVWDIVAQETYSIRLPSNVLRTEIVATQTGWLLRLSPDETPPSFIFCSLHLEECNYYEQPYHFALTASPDGQLIFSAYAGTTSIESYAIWYREEDDEYEIQTEYERDSYPINQGLGLCNLHINSSSTYLSSLCERQLEIWDINLTAIEQGVDDVVMRSWLPDGVHFVALFYNPLRLQLYELGNDEPLDEFLVSDFSDVEGIIRTGDIDETLIVSESGNVVLLNQGSVALLIPIIDESFGE